MALTLLLGSLWLRRAEPATSPTRLHFQEIAAQVGAQNQHHPPRLADAFAHLMPYMTSVGAAVATGDFDGDGWMDLYVLNSSQHSHARLFRNRGDGHFEDVAEAAGVAEVNGVGAAMDAAFLDYDNDGDQDLYVVKWGAGNELYRNRGDGTFENVSQSTGSDTRGYGTTALVFDYNRDGWLDIFVGNFFAPDVIDPASGRLVPNDLWHPVSTRVLPESFTRARNGGRNVLLRNRGDGRFEDVASALGLVHTGWTFDAGAGDLNNDGWPDLYVANDFGPDELYFNTGATETTAGFRLVVDPRGHPGLGDDWWKGMNVEFGDLDGNGRLDIYVTNALVRGYKTDEGNMLWMNYADASRPGGVRFANRATEARVHDGGWGWAAKFADFDRDGLRDIFTVNGFITGADPRRTYWFQLQELVTQIDYNTADARDWPPIGDRDLAGAEPSRLFMQVPARADTGADTSLPRFVEVAVASGITDTLNGRGIALVDHDNDGDIDLYVTNQGAPSLLYRNTDPGVSAGHWLGLVLEGAPERGLEVAGRRLASNRDALGARVELCAGERCQTQELMPSNGFASQSEARLHFGLGRETRVSVDVRWPSGRHTRFPAGALGYDRYVHVSEAHGVLALPVATGKP
jgi:hypothetical protein